MTMYSSVLLCFTCLLIDSTMSNGTTDYVFFCVAIFTGLLIDSTGTTDHVFICVVVFTGLLIDSTGTTDHVFICVVVFTSLLIDSSLLELLTMYSSVLLCLQVY